MTAIDAAPAIAPALPAPTTSARLAWLHARLDHIAFVAVLATWAVPLTRATGGRDPHALLVFSVVSLLALLALRAWRTPRLSSALAAVVAAAALLVCAVTPTGWWGSDVAAGYVTAASAFVIIRTYATTSARRIAVLSGVALASLLQFSDAFLPWWGGRDPSAEMTGTFYWHNPYAAFLLPGALIGLALAHGNARPWRLVGWVAAPLSVAGIVFSSSRATLAVLVVGWLLVGALIVRDRRGAKRVLALTVLAAAVVLLLPGPPFFPHRASPMAATQQRAAAGQSLAENGFYRTEFWREAVQVTEHNPVAGTGFHSLATASALYTPVGWARSQLAHNGYLQAFGDGGLLLGLPFLAAVLLAAGRALRVAGQAVRRRGADADPGVDPVIAASGVALLALMAHSAVDFDWSHPSLLIAAAMIAGVLFSTTRSADAADAPVPPARRYWAISAVAALAGALAITTWTLHVWQQSNAATNALTSVESRLHAADAAFGDARPAESVLQLAVSKPAAVTDDQARRALAITAPMARVDLHLSLLRDAVVAQRGEPQTGIPAARATMASLHGSTAPYVFDFARVLAAAGDNAGAADVLSTELRRQAATGPTPAGPMEMSLLATLEPSAYACLYQDLGPLVSKAGWTGSVPTPAAVCPTSS